MKVYIVGSDGYCMYDNMYRKAGHTVVASMSNADLVQFTGGSDVSPELYGEKAHPQTYYNPQRDKEETIEYKKALIRSIPMVGVCRGGQFLNVMNGGKLYQHVDNHAIMGTHKAIDILTGATKDVTSTHHQMMRPTEKAIIICKAYLSTYQEYMEDDLITSDEVWDDIEAVFYPETKCLCFQPHPEFNWLEVGDAREYFFELIERHIGDL